MKRLVWLAFLLAGAASAQLPKLTGAALEGLIDRPYSQAVAALSGYEGASVGSALWGPSGKWPGCDATGFMHVTDHEYALQCLLGREGTMREVLHSQCVTGSALISQAFRQCGGPVSSLYGCLTHALGTANGSRVFDRIIAGTSPTKGSFAGVPYDCSMWPIPGGTPPVQPPTDPPKPPEPPKPAPVCTPRALSPEIRKALVDALARTSIIRPKWRTQYQAAITAIDAYRPCLESTGKLEMILRDELAP